jgi:hypothetical protein
VAGALVAVAALAVGALAFLVERLRGPIAEERRAATRWLWRVVGAMLLLGFIATLAIATYAVLRSNLDPQLKRWLLTRAAALLFVLALAIAGLRYWARQARRSRRARWAARYGLLSSPLLLVGVAILVILFVQRTSLAPSSQAAPAQPIDFSHLAHVEVLGLDCTFCHRTALTQANAGLPALEQCMFCHRTVNLPANAGIQTLISDFQSGQPVDWTRVYQLPDHVYFDHEAHMAAGVSCASCHGDVGTMVQVRQVENLRMQDCVACHVANNAPTECATCHQ